MCFCDARVLHGVDLGHRAGAGGRFGHAIQGRVHHDARPAPRGPEVDQDEPATVDQRLERVRIDGNRLVVGIKGGDRRRLIVNLQFPPEEGKRPPAEGDGVAYQEKTDQQPVPGEPHREQVKRVTALLEPALQDIDAQEEAVRKRHSIHEVA